MGEPLLMQTRGFAIGAFAFVRSWWSLLGGSLPSLHLLPPPSAAASLGDVAVEHTASVDCAGQSSEDEDAATASHGVSVDFPHLLVSLVRASVSSKLATSAPTEHVSASRLAMNHCLKVEYDAARTSSVSQGDARVQAGWHDACPLAAASWLADMSCVDVGKELAVFRRYLLQALPDLVSIDESAAAALVLDLLGDEKATDVVAAIENYPRLQVGLELLRYEEAQN